MVFHRVKLVRRRVRTAASFQARDPWHGGTLTDFTVEVYRLVPEHARDTSAAWLWGGAEHFGLRSDLDGLDRPLPEALAELFHTGRVPATELPGLLQAMEPELGKADFQPVLHHRLGKWLSALLPLGLLALWGFFVARGQYQRAVAASFESPPDAGAFLAQPWREGEMVRSLEGGLPIAGSLDDTFTANVPRGVSAPIDTSSRLGWVQTPSGPRPVLMAAHAYFLPAVGGRRDRLEVTLGSILRLDEVGLPAEMRADLLRQAPGIDPTLVLCQGWRLEPASGGMILPIVLVVVAFASLAGAFACAALYPAFELRRRKRREQMEWALSRLGGFHG